MSVTGLKPDQAPASKAPPVSPRPSRVRERDFWESGMAVSNFHHHKSNKFGMFRTEHCLFRKNKCSRHYWWWFRCRRRHCCYIVVLQRSQMFSMMF